MVFNHNKRGATHNRIERRRGLISHAPKEKLKVKPVKKLEKVDIQEILKQGRMKNKEEIENLLLTRGGNYKPDFGLRETMDFNESKGSGWNTFFSYVQGTLQDQRIEQTKNKFEGKDV